MKIENISHKIDGYDLKSTVYVWDNFLSQELSDFYDEKIFCDTNWRYMNQVNAEYCQHTLWGKSYTKNRPDYIDRLIFYIEEMSGLKIFKPDYIGLNGQTKHMDACPHQDCSLSDSEKSVSFLYYIGCGDADGDLIFYENNYKNNTCYPGKELNRIEFIKNRLIIMDGHKMHSAEAPSKDTLRMSFVYRGFYVS